MTAIPADPLDASNGALAAESSVRVAGRLSAFSLLIFSGPALPLSALALPLVVYLPHFYAAQMGMSLTTVGAIFSIVRLLDIAFDPLLGAIMDRTDSRFGRFRPWMVAAIPILLVASWMVFMPPKGATAPYLVGSLLLLYAGYSMAVLGHLAWGGTLAGAYHERSRIFGWVQAGTVGGLILVMILPVVLAKVAKNSEAAGVASIGWFVMVLAPITIGLAVWRLREPMNANPSTQRAGLTAYLQVIRRPAVMRIVTCTVLLATAPGITGAVFLFFFREARGFDAAQTNLLLLIYFVGGFAGAPLWSKLAKRIGKHRAMMAACVYYVLMQGIFLLLPKGSMALAVPVILLAGLAFSAYLILLRAMTADACDEARLDLSRDCTGMIYALQNAGTKVGSALGVAITFPILQQVYGFVAKDGVINTPYAIQGLQLAFVVLPVISVILGGLALVGYQLTEGRHNEVRQALEARDAA